MLLELRRRGYRVSVGRAAAEGRDDLEIDFVAERGAERVYVQVAVSVVGDDTLAREVRALRSADDHFPKVLLALDALPPALPDGLLYQDARAFLGGEPLPAPLDPRRS